jgi:hypothetical protein
MANPYVLELFKSLLGVLTLCLGWFFGQRIVAYWDIKKKRQELDIAIARDFQKLYGEFKEVSRLWRICTYKGPKSNLTELPPTLPVELLRRATAAEGGIEAIIVKLATERELTDDEVRSLGLFRQAYQKLREQIRDALPLEWTHQTPEYHLYNDLAAAVAAIISSNAPKEPTRANEAGSTLRRITAVRPSDWEQAVMSHPAGGRRNA